MQQHKFYALKCLGTPMDEMYMTQGDTYFVKVPVEHDNYSTKGRLLDDRGEEVFIPLFFFSDAVSHKEVSAKNGWFEVECTSSHLRDFMQSNSYRVKRCEDRENMLMAFDLLGKLRFIHKTHFNVEGSVIEKPKEEETFVSKLSLDQCFPLPEFEVFDEKGLDFEIVVEDNQLISYGDEPLDEVEEGADHEVNHEYSKMFVANCLKTLTGGE